MSALLWALVGVISLVLLVLLTPWHLRFQGTTSPPKLEVRLRLLGGLAPGIPIPLNRSKDREKPRKDRKPRKRRRNLRSIRGVRDLVSGLLSALRVRHIRIRGRIGLPDPADTGMLWGYLTPAIYTLGQGDRVIDIAPDFSGPCFDLNGSGDLVIRPTTLARAGLRFAWVNRGAP